MSAPVREPDDDGPLHDGPLHDGPLNDAPQRTRRPDRYPNRTSKRGDAASSRKMPEMPEPPWKRRTQGGAFEGDIAAAELRSRIALMPDGVPEPPFPATASPRIVNFQCLAAVIAVVAAGAIGYRWGSAPPVDLPQLALASGQAVSVPELPAPKPDSMLPAAQPVTTGVAWRGVADDAITATAVQHAESPATDAQSFFSPSDSQPAIAPPAFAMPNSAPGAFALQPDAVAGRKNLQLESSRRNFVGTGRSAPQAAGDADEIATLMKAGAELMANGDIVAARMMFRHVAEAGAPAAAFALAETYDPLVLRKLRTIGGIASDVALAQSWYEKARDMGSAAAPERIARLARRSE